ncbi:evolutionarily conserved signaling intermediate in Toll pathway, mitochondrial isoform X2 [Mirounga angustirostris]|uniref:evolutionarily conserved signaling intermediate in Toll pathway, mitochondrial isoform X2 n=1 Tax=Mirounga angustirostris TaxID=9716 RepID=UPI00313BE139
MSWAQAILLARGLSRGWGGICGAALMGGPFSQAPEGARDKANFVRVVQNFGQHNVHKRGHVDFIYLALRKMQEYGVERDLAVYNLLLDIFPKEVFRPRSIFQSMFIHYPRQQECGIAVLEQMESHGVMPNKETEFLLIQIFGRKSYPMLKYVRMKLWFSRFKNINPFPVPRDLPQDPVDLAKLGLRHMEPNLSATVTIYQESRLLNSRLPWPTTTQPGLSSSRAPFPCGSETNVSIITSSELTCCPLRRGKWKKFQRNGISTTRCSWTWITGGAAGMTMSLTSIKWRKALSSPYAWRVPTTKLHWPGGSRACRRPTQPWPRSPWSSAWRGPPGSSWRPPPGWRSRPHPRPHQRARKKRRTVSSDSSRARAELERSPAQAVDWCDSVRCLLSVQQIKVLRLGAALSLLWQCGVSFPLMLGGLAFQGICSIRDGQIGLQAFPLPSPDSSSPSLVISRMHSG